MWKVGRSVALALTALLALAVATTAQAADKVRVALGDVVSVETLAMVIALERAKERGVDYELTSFAKEDLAIQAIVWAIYGLISLATALYNPVVGLDLRGWLLGTVPLLLNATLLGALLMLLAPMVLPPAGRLAVLALIAIAFSGSLIGGQTLAELPSGLTAALSVLRTIFSTPLLPAFTGFALSVSRDYSGIAFAIPLAQLSLTLGLLAMAAYIFSRREIIFSGA